VIELDYGIRVVVAGDDVERALAAPVRERAAVAQPERETSEAIGCVRGALQTSRVEQRGQLLAVISVEVDRREGRYAAHAGRLLRRGCAGQRSSLHDLRAWITCSACSAATWPAPAASRATSALRRWTAEASAAFSRDLRDPLTRTDIGVARAR